ncbi:hypothetical protein DMC25_06955 [Caulobacter sp. D4A]|uniref:O-linked N-acetylglucosamine transferase, SPINDLY family protein n=1 Tax=unclassified Caulobacter TaxID=2648921 RepID=UPI000D72AACA|nr:MULTISPECIES: hypothetical protein [unclassified Caulobacter]PXA90776.1 hypothetical protein DMC25_06955 [Caulobacter sp. D4A]PXA94234.1 hypothetical protein DMC18_06760 [Caulobacter sp. D5]
MAAPEQDLLRTRNALLTGKPAVALHTAKAAVAKAPGTAEPLYWLASAQAANRDPAAAQTLNDARLTHGLAVIRAIGGDAKRLTTEGEYALQIGHRLYNANYPACASVAFGLAVIAGRDEPQSLVSLGLAFLHQGRAEEANNIFRALSEAMPDSAPAQQFELYSLFMVQDGVARHAQAARAWAERFETPVLTPALPPAPLAGRRLRVGYVAPVFSSGQIRQFMAPLLDHHDTERFEIFLYPNEADTTDWGAAPTVRPIGALKDDEAVALIRQDQIDVLIDAWGHTSGSRLGIFARRAAPVQATWLNYQQTTGLRAMDFAIHSQSILTPGMEALFTETVWPVEPISAPFRADPATPSPAPSLASGSVTFGSFINPSKLSDEAVAGWSRLLLAVAGSRLLLKYRYFEDPVLARATTARFAAHGVDPDRLVYEGHSQGDDYEQAFARIDLSLDPSPCPGGTTTLEALARGVPVITLRGPTFYSRIGVQLVEGAGLPDLVADNWDDYVAKAAAAAADPASLQALRDRTWEGFAKASFRDEALVTRTLEEAYLGMFAAKWPDQA